MKRLVPSNTLNSKSPAAKRTLPAKPPVQKRTTRPVAEVKATPTKRRIAPKPSPVANLHSATPASKASASPASNATKQSQLITLLRSAPGGTLEVMMKLTGWQRHTVRGMLSGSLRKRLGLDVQSQLVDGIRVYRIAKGSTQ